MAHFTSAGSRFVHRMSFLTAFFLLFGMLAAEVGAAGLTASVSPRPRTALATVSDNVTINFHATDANGLSLEVSVVDEHGDAVIVPQSQVVTSSDWNWTFNAPDGVLGFYRVYASLYSGTTEVQKLTTANASRPNGFLTYAIVPNPTARPASLPEDRAFFGMQGGFAGMKNVAPDIFAFLGVRWQNDGGWKWCSLSSSYPGWNGVSPMPGMQDSWAEDGNGGAWTIHNIPALTKDGAPYGGSPEVYISGTCVYNSGELKAAYEPDWADFCGKVAAAWPGVYANRQQPVYEITWEPIKNWGYAGSYAGLVRFYELAYGAIKSVDPDAWVMGPCGATDLQWGVQNETLMNLGILNYLDAWSAHVYMETEFGAIRDPEINGYPTLLRTYRRDIRGRLGYELPMYCTEQGHRTREDLSWEIRQARRLIRSNLMMLGERWKVNLAFYFADYYGKDNLDEVYRWDWGFFYNLDTPSYAGYAPTKVSPKPVVPAYAAMTFLLENRHNVQDLNWLGARKMGYAFEGYDDPDDVVLAMWRYQPTGTDSDDVDIDTGVAQVTVYDWMGNATVMNTTDGVLTLTLGEEPLYVAGVDADIWGSARPQRNVALNKPTNCSSVAGADWNSDNATDGDSVSYKSRWVSQADPTNQSSHWITVDLQGDYEIDEVRFWTGAYDTGGSHLYRYPIPTYDLQGWTGASWTNLVPRRTGNGQSVVRETFDPVTVSKVRIYVPTWQTSQVRLFELEVLATSTADYVTTVESQADTCVRDGQYADDNFGDWDYMVVKNQGPDNDYTRESFVRYDLSSIGGTITNATLKLYPISANGTTTHRLELVGDDSWGEMAVTWNTKPSSSGTAIAAWTPTAGTPVEVDVTAAAQSELAGDGKLSLRVLAPSVDGWYVTYGTYENANQSYHPVLDVTHTQPAGEPPSGSEYNLEPTNDASVLAANPDTNYGSSTALYARGGATPQESYLTYDLSGVSGTVESATLTVCLAYIDWNATHKVALANSDSWSQGTITWNNRPGHGAEFFSDAYAYDDDGIMIDIDVTSQVQAEMSDNQLLSLCIYSISDVAANYASSEHATQAVRPVLNVVTSGGSSGSGEISVEAAADSYCRSGTYADTNYGDIAYLAAKYDGPSGGYTRDFFMRFDLSGVSEPITSAKLLLYPESVSGTPTTHILRRVSSDAWGEMTITWNNSPAADPSSLASWQPTAGTPVEVDITAAVQSEAASDGALSLYVYSQNWDGRYVTYGSRENANPDRTPKLIINGE